MTDTYSLFLDRPDTMHFSSLISTDSVLLPLPPTDSSLQSDAASDPLHNPSLKDSNGYSCQSPYQSTTMELISGSFHGSQPPFQQGFMEKHHSIILDMPVLNMPMPVYPSPSTDSMNNVSMDSMMLSYALQPVQTTNIINQSEMASGMVYGLARSDVGSTNYSTFMEYQVENTIDINPIKFELVGTGLTTFAGNGQLTQVNPMPIVSQGDLVNRRMNGQIVSGVDPNASVDSGTVSSIVGDTVSRVVGGMVRDMASGGLGVMATGCGNPIPHVFQTQNQIPKRESSSSGSHASPEESAVSRRDSLASLIMAPLPVHAASSPRPSFPTAVSIPAGNLSHIYKIVRGITIGGSPTRPPPQERPGYKYQPLELVIDDILTKEECLLHWSEDELADRRRIVRLERTQRGTALHAHFLIVGLALTNPEPAPAEAGVDVIEFSCLECLSSEVSLDLGGRVKNFFVTSVEIVAIVEMLVGILGMDAKMRRKEKGRIRSNLTPFWLKKPISSKKGSEHHHLSPRMGFARRIMGYRVRKPRGFDKDVRILPWEKLLSALNRALQCYYVEVPEK